MFKLGSFDDAFAQDAEDNRMPQFAERDRRRKTIGQRLTFWGANLVVMPMVALCYLTVGAEGLRQLMSIFQMRLYKAPIPGAGLLRQYDGFDRLDLSMCMALILLGAVTFIWLRIFTELQESGALAQQRRKNPIYFYLLAVVAAIVVLGDAGIFYIGLEHQTSNGWGETPAYVPAAATVIYMAGLALIGAWHSDHSYSKSM